MHRPSGTGNRRDDTSGAALSFFFSFGTALPCLLPERCGPKARQVTEGNATRSLTHSFVSLGSSSRPCRFFRAKPGNLTRNRWRQPPPTPRFLPCGSLSDSFRPRFKASSNRSSPSSPLLHQPPAPHQTLRRNRTTALASVGGRCLHTANEKRRAGAGGGIDQQRRVRRRSGAAADVRAGDAADGRAGRRRSASQEAARSALVRRSAPELRPAPSGQALRRPVPNSAEAGERGGDRRSEGRRRRRWQRQPAAGAAAVSVAGAGGGAEAGRGWRQKRGSRRAARARLGRAVGAPPVGDDARGRELRAQSRTRTRRRGSRRRRLRTARGGRRVVGRPRGVRRHCRRWTRHRQPPALTEINHPLIRFLYSKLLRFGTKA